MGGAGVDGTSSSEVQAAVLAVQEEARRAFGPLLDRQAKAERIKLVLGVIKRYEVRVGAQRWRSAFWACSCCTVSHRVFW